MNIKIPLLSRKEDMEPIQNAIAFAASKSGRSEAEVAKLMSWFLEGLADEVTCGKVVRIPGFGIFAPVPKKTSRDPHPRCRPRFEPSLAFSRQVIYGAPPNREGARAIKAYRGRHGAIYTPPKNRAGERVFTAMQKFREDIDAQLAQTS